jgi:hypothetical protein
MTTCRSCDAEVVFVPSAKSGKPMILDAKPTKGIVILDSTEPCWEAKHADIVIREAPDPRARVATVYTDHHVTCPNADDWKGKTRAGLSA